jgi:hypothetical protein
MKAYPVFTEENFEDMYHKYVRQSYKKGKYIKVKKPCDREEFAALTEAMYGKPLGLRKASLYGYEVEEPDDEYRSWPVMRLWEKKCGQYDGVKVALNTTFGRITCGGTARSAYGQFAVESRRDKVRIGNFK